MQKKVLLIRLDKIGDLVSTLPVDQSVLLKDTQVRWIISKGLDFIANAADPKRHFYEIDKKNVELARKTLRNILKEYQPDIAVSFQAPWWVSYELFRAKVPLRVGSLSQWHSFIFLNCGLRQKRSQSVQHEFHYNLDLIYKAFSDGSENFNELKKVEYENLILKLKSSQLSDELRKLIGTDNYWVLHPGMAGSALNWSVEKYIQLINDYLTESKKSKIQNKIVITGTPMDEPWVGPIKKIFDSNSQVIFLQNKLSTTELLSVLGSSKCVLAPSTGVLHLAASLGVPTIGIFSPIRVQSTIRWGARGKNVHLFSPEVKCPASHRCLNEKCSQYNCMEQIKVVDVLALIMNILKASND